LDKLYQLEIKNIWILFYLRFVNKVSLYYKDSQFLIAPSVYLGFLSLAFAFLAEIKYLYEIKNIWILFYLRFVNKVSFIIGFGVNMIIQSIFSYHFQKNTCLFYVLYVYNIQMFFISNWYNLSKLRKAIYYKRKQ
jgi:hypothetical protein